MNKKRVAEPAVEETSAAELTQAQDTPQPDPTDAQPTPAPNPEPVEQPAEEQPVEQPAEQSTEQPAEPVQAAAESDAPVADTSPVEAKPRKQRKSSAELKADSEEKRQAKSQAAAAKRKADQARKAAANRNKGKSSSKKTAKPTLAQKRADKKAARLAAKTEAANQKAQEAADKQAALQSQKAAAAAQKQAKAQQKADRKAQRRTKKKPLTAEERKQLKRDKKEALKQLAQQRKQILHNQLPPKPQPKQPLPETEFFGKKLPYPGNFPVYCCKYVICRDASPSVALRFFNASDITVTGLRFTITQKDGDGNPIESVTMERLGLFAESSTEFAVADAPVSASCEEIDVCVNTVRSDDYEDIIDDSGQVTLSYGTNKLGKEFFFKEAPTYSVKKKRKGYTLLALGAVLGMVTVMLLVLMAMGVFS